VHKTGAAVPEGQEFTIAGLAPSRAQKRFALGVFIVLLTGLALPMGEFGSVQLARLHAFVPVYATAMAVTDLLTSVLLFAQFSILRTKALLVISSGYLFTGLMAVPWMLTFPGAFTPEGLLGAGLHTTSWIYILWHGGFPLFVLGYALLKDQDEPVKRVWPFWSPQGTTWCCKSMLPRPAETLPRKSFLASTRCSRASRFSCSGSAGDRSSIFG
jgi:hypothetical protein